MYNSFYWYIKELRRQVVVNVKIIYVKCFLETLKTKI